VEEVNVYAVNISHPRGFGWRWRASDDSAFSKHWRTFFADVVPEAAKQGDTVEFRRSANDFASDRGLTRYLDAAAC
jgi:hypothetical protein